MAWGGNSNQAIHVQKLRIMVSQRGSDGLGEIVDSVNKITKHVFEIETNTSVYSSNKIYLNNLVVFTRSEKKVRMFKSLSERIRKMVTKHNFDCDLQVAEEDSGKFSVMYPSGYAIRGLTDAQAYAFQRAHREFCGFDGMTGMND